jgi:RNA polymerase sigma factor (sigma-70 family)
MELTDQDIEFANSCTTKLRNRWGAPPIEDIYAAGRLGLVLAARSYDPSKGTTFQYWVSRKVKEQIIEYYREMLGKRNQDYFRSLEFIPFDSNSLELSTDGIERRVIFKDLFEKLRDRVTPEQKEYLNMRIEQHMGNDEIAAEKNIKVDRVDNQFWVIRKRAKELFSLT